HLRKGSDSVTRGLVELSRALNRLTEVAVAVLALFFTGLLVVSVASRYFAHVSIVTSAELTRIAFCWGAFLAAAIAVWRGSHIRITAFVEPLSPAWRAKLERVVPLFTAALGSAMLWYGVSMTLRTLNTYLPALQVSQAWLYAALPTSGALIVVHAIAQVLSGRSSGEPGASTP